MRRWFHRHAWLDVFIDWKTDGITHGFCLAKDFFEGNPIAIKVKPSLYARPIEAHTAEHIVGSIPNDAIHVEDGVRSSLGDGIELEFGGRSSPNHRIELNPGAGRTLNERIGVNLVGGGTLDDRPRVNPDVGDEPNVIF